MTGKILMVVGFLFLLFFLGPPVIEFITTVVQTYQTVRGQ